jgi:hypothetical protein
MDSTFLNIKRKKSYIKRKCQNLSLKIKVFFKRKMKVFLKRKKINKKKKKKRGLKKMKKI